MFKWRACRLIAKSHLDFTIREKRLLEDIEVVEQLLQTKSQP
jgi:hypothetical protein